MFSHLSSVCMTYVEHCKFSLEMAGVFSYAAFTAVVHAFFTELFCGFNYEKYRVYKKEIR